MAVRVEPSFLDADNRPAKGNQMAYCADKNVPDLSATDAGYPARSLLNR